MTKSMLMIKRHFNNNVQNLTQLCLYMEKFPVDSRVGMVFRKQFDRQYSDMWEIEERLFTYREYQENESDFWFSEI